ncbi:MAG: hypothetical protein LBF38_04385 [Deltaproteobacteria bacterium]|jgi:hypothetical protein|nr:hypothetical protein [Deltaproteobacteria bacterium]
MFLSKTDSQLFFKIWLDLVYYVNFRHKVVPVNPKPGFEDEIPVEPQDLFKIRNALWEHPQWIDYYLLSDDKPTMSQEEHEILAGWRAHFVKGDFFLIAGLNKYAAVVSDEKRPRLFGVTGLTAPLVNVYKKPLPLKARLVLLPFKGQIIYDSITELYETSFGFFKRFSLYRKYLRLRKTSGFIEKLTGQ